MENIPLKSDLEPYSILASETQERMLIVSTKSNSDMIAEILKKWDLEFNIIGNVTCNDKYTVYKIINILLTFIINPAILNVIK